jgi:hypothetical protein
MQPVGTLCSIGCGPGGSMICLPLEEGRCVVALKLQDWFSFLGSKDGHRSTRRWAEQIIAMGAGVAPKRRPRRPQAVI